MSKADSNVDQGNSPPPDKRSESENASPKAPMTLLETTQSVLWAMLGVQSKRNAQRDFSQGKFIHFVVIGLVFALVFILTLATIINWVLGDVA